MQAFALSIAVGFGVGLIYAALQVRSPAPPLIALAGLLGMVMGEQTLPLLKQWAGLGQGNTAVTSSASTPPSDDHLNH